MRYKLLARWLICFVVCFLVVCLACFAIGNKLVEGWNMALFWSSASLIVVSVSLIVGTVIFHFSEESRSNKAKIKELEEKIAQLEGSKGL